MKKTIYPIIAVSLLLASTSFANDLQNYLKKGHDLANEKKYSEAVGEYEKALKIDPKNLRANLFLGLTYAQSGDFDKAIQYSKSASEIDPSYSSFYYLGLIYAAHNTPDKAIESFDRALSLNPQSYEAEYQKGLVYASQESFDQARTAYENAVKLNPNFEEARLALATASYKEGDKSAALNQVDELRKLKKKNLADALEGWINSNPA